MKKIILIIILVVFGCSKSQKTAFENLSTAFIEWHSKNFQKTEYLLHQNNPRYSFNSYDNELLSEQYRDLKRFSVELSQIDKTRLSTEDRIEYNILVQNIKIINYKYDNWKVYDWDSSLIISDIINNIRMIVENENVENLIKLEGLIKVFNQIPLEINNHRLNLEFYSKSSHLLTNNKIDELFILFETLPYKFNAENAILDELDSAISVTIKKVNSYQKWINNDLSKRKERHDAISKNDYIRLYEIITGNSIPIDKIYEIAKREVVSSQNKMFDLALPEYLENNDEPVYVDRIDSLNVIKWVLKSHESELEVITSLKLNNSVASSIIKIFPDEVFLSSIDIFANNIKILEDSNEFNQLLVQKHILASAIQLIVEIDMHVRGINEEDLNNYISSNGMNIDPKTNSKLVDNIIMQPMNSLFQFVGFIELINLHEELLTNKKNFTNDKFIISLIDNGGLSVRNHQIKLLD
jgi:hypothetical protein